MADSIKEQIELAFEALLKTITTENGYVNNLGWNVFRGKDAPLEKDELPGLVVNTGGERSDSTINAGFDHHWLPFDLSARANYMDDAVWQKVCNSMLADMVKAMGTDTNLGGLAFDIQIGDNQTGVDDGKNLIAGTDLNVTVHYRTRHLDPYN